MCIIICFNVTPVFSADSELLTAYENLLKQKPYTNKFIEYTQKLYDARNKQDTGDVALEQKVDTILMYATARIDFMMEDTINRLGDINAVTVLNYKYVSETLNDITNTYKMPMMKQHSPQNEASYIEFIRVINLFEANEVPLLKLYKAIEELAPTDNITNVLDVLSKNDKYYDLIPKEHYDKIMTHINTNMLPNPRENIITIPESDLNISKPNFNSLFSKAHIDTPLPNSLAKQILTGYRVIGKYKFLYDKKGGKIAPTTFTYNVDSPNVYFMREDCLPFADIDANPNTYTFTTKWLGNYYIIEPFDFYPYSTDFTSKMEWRFHNALMAKLIFNAQAFNADTIEFYPNGIKNIPLSVVKTIADLEKSILIKGENGEPDALLWAKAFSDFKATDEFIPLEVLNTYAKNTEKDSKYVDIENVNKTPQSQNQSYPSDLFDDDPNETTFPSITRMLAIAGLFVALAAIALLIKKDAQKNRGNIL